MTPVDVLYNEYVSIIDFLDCNGQPSLSSDVNKYFKKVIVLSSGSFFEHKIQEMLVQFVVRETNNNSLAINFFKKKAIGMQYHTYFSWGEKNKPDKPGQNANSFFSLFGDDFKKQVEDEIKRSVELETAVKSFLEIGHLRNILVHSNFAAYDIENKTADEIFQLYKNGLPFISYIESKLKKSS
jgi:hypothetical protein